MEKNQQSHKNGITIQIGIVPIRKNLQNGDNKQWHNIIKMFAMHFLLFNELSMIYCSCVPVWSNLPWLTYSLGF